MARATTCLREGIDHGVHVTGNTVIDALLDVAARIGNDTALADTLGARFPFLARDRRMLLVTGHRRENFGAGFERICRALHAIAMRGDVDVVYPVHLNPNVQEPVHRILGDCPAVHLVEPPDYLPFVWLMLRSDVILTELRRHPGRSAVAGQAGAGDARCHRTARSGDRGHGRTVGTTMPASPLRSSVLDDLVPTQPCREHTTRMAMARPLADRRHRPSRQRSPA